jgi:thiol-disulfide isomerase/thioredoxin
MLNCDSKYDKMKTKLLTLFLTACLFLSVNAQEKSVEISGTIVGTNNGKIFLQKFQNKMFSTIGSSEIKNGQFHFTSKIVLPEIYGLTSDTTQHPLFLFLESNNNLVVNFDAANPDQSIVKGSAANDVYNNYKNLPGDVKIDSFIRKNAASLASLYILYREYSYRLSPVEIEQNIALLDASFETTQYVKALRELVIVLNKVAIGKQATDFTLTDTSGQAIKLSSHFGKYLLLDFWASWCGPCRQENPKLVLVYQKYKNKGFDIFSVSLDKKKANWLKAIQADKLTWTHASDLAFWNSAPAKLYGIRAIPSNVLIDPSGVIIAKNLESHELDKKLEELLKK